MEPSIVLLTHRFIVQSRYGVVSSISSVGHPQSALVGIAVTPELELIFDTVKSSRKYPNLIMSPLCSVVIVGSGEVTVQLEGLAAEPQGAELERYQAIYFAAWPECRAHSLWPDIAYLVVRPHWIRYSDYDQQPSLIEEVELRSAQWLRA